MKLLRIVYFKDAHKNRFKVNFESLTNPDEGLLLMECEYVNENIDSGDFYVLSVADDLSYGTLSERNNPKLKKVLISQFIDYKIEGHTNENFHKYYPWIYFSV